MIIITSLQMAILDKIRRALDQHQLSSLKKKIARLEIQAAKQGKTVERLTIVLHTRPGSLPSRFEFVLSDGSTNQTGKNPNQVAPVQEPEPGLKTRDCDEKSMSVEDYDEAGVKVFTMEVNSGMNGSVPHAAVYWIENKEKVYKHFNLTATPPAKGTLISFSVKTI